MKAPVAILFFLSSLTLAQAQEVFSLGTGAMPNPAVINPAQSLDFSPSAALGSNPSLTGRGNWGASTSYSLGDRVTFNGVDFVAIKPNTSSGSFSADIASGRWMLYSSWTFRGFYTSRFLSLSSYGTASAWSSSSAYSFGDTVTWQGLNFVALYAHQSDSSFSSDIDRGYWVLRQHCPSLSAYSQPTPVGNVCQSFDSYFQSGKSTFAGSTKLLKKDLNNTGTDLAGSLDISVTFDWENETMTPSGTLKLTGYPNMSKGTQELELKGSWSNSSFHQNNTCGRFRFYHYTSYPLPNSTCFSSSNYGFYLFVDFFEKDDQFIPVMSFTPPAASSPKDVSRFYNSLFNKMPADDNCVANTTHHHIPTAAATMK